MYVSYKDILGMSVYVGTVILGLLMLLGFYLLLAALVAGKKPLAFLAAIREPQLLAFSTSSSAAVMPLSMKTAHEKLGVRQSLAQFVVPLGATVGSISAGHPLTSYVLGGELLANGISLVAVTALLVSWVTVGSIQFPAEALMLGRRFAFYRNLLCFVFSIIIALLTAMTLHLLG